MAIDGDQDSAAYSGAPYAKKHSLKEIFYIIVALSLLALVLLSPVLYRFFFSLPLPIRIGFLALLFTFGMLG
eukprot:SAG11_NODE_11367_length_765_cov_1.678679_1_plen_71_part_01